MYPIEWTAGVFKTLYLGHMDFLKSLVSDNKVFKTLNFGQ